MPHVVPLPLITLLPHALRAVHEGGKEGKVRREEAGPAPSPIMTTVKVRVHVCECVGEHASTCWRVSLCPLQLPDRLMVLPCPFISLPSLRL